MGRGGEARGEGASGRFSTPPSGLGRQKAEQEESRQARKVAFPKRATRDVLWFRMRCAPLEDWQVDVLSIIRDEAYYFAPQAMTKVMNEGWATYWHSKLMTQHFLEAREIVHYADQHSGVVHMPAGGFNPYKIGVEMFKEIEERWDKGQHGPAWERLDSLGAKRRYDDKSMKGRDKIFEVRRIYNDVNFIDEFLTPDADNAIPVELRALLRSALGSATTNTQQAATFLVIGLAGAWPL